MQQCAMHSSFNPHPPRRVGATLARRDALRTQLVSILTHPEGWALHSAIQANRINTGVSILTHPEGWALPGVTALQVLNGSFQSSPTPKGGRYSQGVWSEVLADGFNPHPPRRVGATLAGWLLDGGNGVSILTHPEGWALRR